jgi:hypothetical protein
MTNKQLAGLMFYAFAIGLCTGLVVAAEWL